MQGLGKTITALSLVLSTKGLRPAAPPGREVVNLSDAQGRKAAFYTVEGRGKHEAHGGASGVSRRSDRSQRPSDRYSPDDEKSAPKPPRPVPGRTLRSNSVSAARRLADEEAAQDKQDKAAGSPSLAGRLQDNGCTAAGCPGAEGAHEHDGPFRKRQKLDSSSSEVGGLSCCEGGMPMTAWVQCDACSKWRSLDQVTHILKGKPHHSERLVRYRCRVAAASGGGFDVSSSVAAGLTDADHVQVPAEATWMCTMHPDPAYRSCRVPQERVPSDDRYLECDGYVASPKSQMGNPDNVKYFGELVMRHLRSVDSRQRVLTWLGSLKHKELLVGVKVGAHVPRLTRIPCLVVSVSSHQRRCCGPPKRDSPTNTDMLCAGAHGKAGSHRC